LKEGPGKQQYKKEKKKRKKSEEAGFLQGVHFDEKALTQANIFFVAGERGGTITELSKGKGEATGWLRVGQGRVVGDRKKREGL